MPRTATVPASASNIIPLNPRSAESDLLSTYVWWEDSLRSRDKRPNTLDSYRLTVETFDRFMADHGLSR